MLNGIGGTTITQAQETLSLKELEIWKAYRDKRGGLNTAARNEFMLAQLALVLAKVNGAKNLSIEDFSPSMQKPVITNENDFAKALDAMGMLDNSSAN